MRIKWYIPAWQRTVRDLKKMSAAMKKCTLVVCA